MRLLGIPKAIFPLIVLASVVAPARADTFGFSYNEICDRCGPFVGNQEVDLFVNIKGVLTTTNSEVGGAVTITGITGTRSANWFLSAGSYSPQPVTFTITGLIPPDPSNPYGLVIAPDDLLYLSGNSYFDVKGFAFTMSCCGGFPTPNDQIASSFSSYYELGAFGSVGGASMFTLTPIPEPSFFWIFAAVGLAAVLWKASMGRCHRDSS